MPDKNTTHIYYQLKDYIVDICEPKHTPNDIYVYAEYVSPTSYRVHIRRLDTISNEGWSYPLQLILYSPIHGYSERVDAGISETAYKSILYDIPSQIEISPLAPDLEGSPPHSYCPYIPRMSEPHYRQIGIQEFNDLFDSEMVVLPGSFYAIGICNNTTYIYNERYSHYYEIAPTLNFLINILYDRKETHPKQYFVICACDGYPYGIPYRERTIPIAITNSQKYLGIFTPSFSDISETDYEIFHKNRWILTQNNHTGYCETIPMPDHHYFVMNQYREFRALHSGQSWDNKIPKIIFAGSMDRSSKYNFRQHPLSEFSETTQRQYFYQMFDEHPQIVAVKSGWGQSNFISRESQISYKYILDMDGEASTWDSLAWKLRSGSVLFRVDGVWNQWIFRHLVAGRDYIAIHEDFSDLLEKYEWCQSHPEECKQIILNACHAFEMYRLQNAEDYVRNVVLDKI